MLGQEIGRAYIVLLVDDEEMVRHVGKKLLTKLGYEVFVVSSGAEAVDFCNAANPIPDCLLLDYNMPGMNGEETLAAIRAFLPTISAVLSTGYSPEDIGLDLSDGVWDRIVQKPFRLENLSQALGALRDKM